MTIPKIEHNLVDASLEVFQKHQRDRAKRGEIDFSQANIDDVSFVAGFMSCYGILTGKVDVGISEHVPLTVIFDRIQRDLEDYRSRVVGAVREEAKRGG